MIVLKYINSIHMYKRVLIVQVEVTLSSVNNWSDSWIAGGSVKGAAGYWCASFWDPQSSSSQWMHVQHDGNWDLMLKASFVVVLRHVWATAVFRKLLKIWVRTSDSWSAQCHNTLQGIWTNSFLWVDFVKLVRCLHSTKCTKLQRIL